MPLYNQKQLSPLLIFLGIIILMSSSRLILPIIIVGGIAYFFIIKVLPIIQKKQGNVIDVDSSPNQTEKFNINKYITNMNKKIGIIAIVIVAILILVKSIMIIPPGMTGVQHLFGKVNDSELSSGLHLINPLALVEKMSIRTEEYTMSDSQGEGKRYESDVIDALTKEGLKVELDITVLYHLKEGKASNIFKDLGRKYEEKLIRPQIRSVIRGIIAQYEAKDIYSEKRQETAQRIKEKLQEQISPRGLEVEEVLLRNVKLPAKLEASIQEKLTAEQDTQRYDFLLAKEEKEKQRKVIEAEGQRDAQKIINESLTARYLEYLYIQGLKDREGTIYIPISPDNGLPMFKGL